MQNQPTPAAQGQWNDLVQQEVPDGIERYPWLRKALDLAAVSGNGKVGHTGNLKR